MLCPEGEQIQKEPPGKELEKKGHKEKKVLEEGSGSLELKSFKNPKTWKKSITNFFRNQLRSTKSNDGDRPSGSKEDFGEKEISPEQKWQSLGKIFRRQSFAEHWEKSSNHQGETTSHPHGKKHAVRKVLSSYFARNQTKPSTSASDDE